MTSIKKMICFFSGFAMFFSLHYLTTKQKVNKLKLSDYVTITISVPESHATAVREAIASAEGGKVGNYSHCSLSIKGIGRFKPEKGSNRPI